MSKINSSEYNKEYYLKNKEKIKLRKQAYYQANKTRINTKVKEWRHIHWEVKPKLPKENLSRELLLERRAATRKNRKRQYKTRTYVTQDLKGPWLRFFQSTKKSKLTRHKEHTLTAAQVKEMWFRDKAYEMIRPSIDRIDPKKGYVFENCRFLELVNNWARHYYPNHNLQINFISKP